MEREHTIVTGLTLMLLGVWLSFFVHQSPRFAGSAWGGVLGVAAALCMLVPLGYTVVKRIAWVKEALQNPRLQPLILSLHIYASLVGAFLAILHSGHKFQSWFGIALMTSMLLSIFSGYVGRHFLRYVSVELTESQRVLAGLRAAYAELAKSLPSRSLELSGLSIIARFRKGLANIIAGPSYSQNVDPIMAAINLVDAIADMEYAIRAGESIKRKLRIWLAVHISTSIAFYTLLLLHITASIQFGLRWFS